MLGYAHEVVVKIMDATEPSIEVVPWRRNTEDVSGSGWVDRVMQVWRWRPRTYWQYLAIVLLVVIGCAVYLSNWSAHH